MPTPHTSVSTRPTLEVLVVDDSPVQRALLSHALEKWGYHVTVAEDGGQAFEISSTFEFDLVLMDVEMPVMDGLAAARAIRQRERATSRHITIVALTSTDSREECLSSGMDGFMQKPVRFPELNAILQSL